MIEISFGKLLLLAIIALIVLGPEKLPHAARTAGTLLRRLRAGWDSVRAEVERELEIEEIRRVAREAAAQAEAAQAKLDLAQAQINRAASTATGAVSADVGAALGAKEPTAAGEPGSAPLMTGPLPEERRVQPAPDATATAAPATSAPVNAPAPAPKADESDAPDEVSRGHA
ncbi:Sec-independent protein translocase protein TatB [Dyella sp.]|jgi:sec-independent protein translocase protein TatB|uniref:Sec-independent protein translocase protein TatB n=1 Tax=Dyella sp. TaxID=1869338 RepID=UPI002D798729|nr:Sec-independent protein translocase protein TatB [Dyella sp.]HET6431382.1 Sec-independent protein translocase protein TatB [Dyella sp.]